MSKELLAALDALESEKGIERQVIIDALEAALAAAYKRNFNQAQNVDVHFDTEKGTIDVMQVKLVVADGDVTDDNTEISLSDALAAHRGYDIGDELRQRVTPQDFGRIAAQTAKQIVMQKIREAGRQAVYDEFADYQDEMITGHVEREDARGLYIKLEIGAAKQDAFLPLNEQMPNERYNIGDEIKVLVLEVRNESKGPQVFVSRQSPDLVKRLFEQEVPEVYEGIVEIMSVAREAGDRSKIAVRTLDDNLDPVGTMVGPRGSRVQSVVNELSGENMDIVEWVEDEAQFIANALNPSEVVDVIFDESDEDKATVIVPDNQLSLAIGKRGQNARLAARLTNFKIDIKPESQAEEILNGSIDDDTQNVVSEETDED